MDLDSLQKHMDERFDHLEELDALRHQGIDKEIKSHEETLKENKQALVRAHTRVDRIETKIKTVSAVGTAVATALGGVGSVVMI